MPVVRSIAALALAAFLAGCSSMSWLPWVGDDDEDDKEKEEELEPVELERFDALVKVDRVWSAKIGDGLGRKYLRMRPAVGADRVFAADGYGVVEARDRFTGKRVWEVEIGETERSFNFFDRRDPAFVTGAAGFAHGLVLIGTTRGEVVALSAVDGSEAWRVKVGAEVLAPPVGGEDLVFVHTEDGRLMALERDTGATRWSFENPVPVLTLRGSSAPVYGDGIVYAGFANGMVSAIRAATGEPVWEHRVMLPEGRSELERMVDVDSTPVLAGNVLFVVAYQGRLKALRTSDGAPLWEQEVSSFLDLAAAGQQVFAVAADDLVAAWNQQSAEQQWSQPGLLRRQLSSPAVFRDYLLVADSEGYLHVLARADGAFVGRRKLGGDGVRSPIVVADDFFYVITNSGSLQALKIEAR